MGGFGSKKQSSVIIVGLDNCGKSTIVDRLKPEKKRAAELVPTVGLKVEKFRHGKVDFTMYDMSGQGRYRQLWEKQYRHAQGIVFVIDSADTARICVAKDELDMILAHKDVARRPIPIIFFANKMDMPKARTGVEISQALELSLIEGRPWHIIRSNALTGVGLEQGLKWLSAHLP
jgi:ADP-ribosylation factor-like protein 6